MDTGARTGDDPLAQATPSRVELLVAECLTCQEDGGEAAIDALLDEHPGLASLVRARLEALRARGLAPGGDPWPEGVPDRLGPYRLLRLLGRGGMGGVYLADRDDLGRQVAIKLLHRSQLFVPGSRERFRREIEAVARLEHPGIVPIHDVGEVDGVPYFAMERIDGIDLGTLLARLRRIQPSPGASRDVAGSAGLGPALAGPWSRVAAKIVQQAAAAVHHAHVRGVIHRDVKPSNIMVTEEGRVVVLDFGLARAQEATRLTQSGALLGSLPYMAPEQVRGETSAVDARTDVYALGVTLYEMLTHQNPFLDESAERTRSRILAASAARLRRTDPTIPRDLETICLEAMREDPARRYPTADALAADLAAFLERRPIAARPPRRSYRAWRWTQRHPARAAAWCLGVLALVAVPATWAVVKTASAARLTRSLEETRALQADTARGRETVRRAYGEARQLLDDIVDRLVVEDVAGDPRLQELQDWVLRRTWETCAGLEMLAEEDIDAWLGLARSAIAIGGVTARVGRNDDARRLLGRTIDTCRRLEVAHRDDPRLLSIEVRALIVLDRVLASEHATGERQAIAGRRLELARLLAARDPAARPALADALAGYARALFVGERDADACAFAEEGLALRRTLLAAGDERQGPQIAMAEAMLMVARARRDGSPQQASALAPLVEAFARAHAAAPDDTQTTADLARYERGLAQALLFEGHPADAEGWFRAAVGHDEEIVRAFPLDPRHRAMCALSWAGLALTLEPLGRHEEAWEAWRRSIEQHEVVCRRRPDDVADGYDLAVAQKSLGSYLCRGGHPEEGLERLARAVGRLGAALRHSDVGEKADPILRRAQEEIAQVTAATDPETLFAIACALARASRDSETHAVEAQGLAGVAVRLLRDAVARDLEDPERIETTPELAELGDRADYRRLINDL